MQLAVRTPQVDVVLYVTDYLGVAPAHAVLCPATAVISHLQSATSGTLCSHKNEGGF